MNTDLRPALEATIAEAEPKKVLSDRLSRTTRDVLDLVVENAYAAVVERLAESGFTLGDTARVELRAALEEWAGSGKLGL